MKFIPFLAVLALVWVGCNNRADELEKQNVALQGSNKQLNEDVATREQYVNRLTDAINEVYASIEEVRAKEHKLMKESGAMESGTTSEASRADMIERIGQIRTVLHEDYAKLQNLQAKLSNTSKQYAGLQKMVANMKTTIEERDKSIAEMSTRVEGLQRDVAEKTEVINQKEQVIDTQHKEIATTFYITGTKHELEEKGIIKDEGGVLWFGQTTTLASGFDPTLFKPFNKEVSTTIQVNGRINEIVPKRSELTYSAAPVNGGDQSLLTIAEPAHFWKDKYLVIITDKESSQN